MKWYVAGAIGIAGVALVPGIGHYAHEYGWTVRMHASVMGVAVAEPANVNSVRGRVMVT